MRWEGAGGEAGGGGGREGEIGLENPVYVGLNGNWASLKSITCKHKLKTFINNPLLYFNFPRPTERCIHTARYVYRKSSTYKFIELTKPSTDLQYVYTHTSAVEKPMVGSDIRIETYICDR